VTLLSAGTKASHKGSSSFARFRAGLDQRDRRSLTAMAATIVVLHVAGFGILFGLVVPHHFHLGGDHPIFNVGVGILAYTFGLRHAFDADHIAAVDNTTRKLIADNEARRAADVPACEIRKPLSVGFWFSLGHSTVVFLLCPAGSCGSSAFSTWWCSSAS
jgi:high-affinity nickel-transport protein